MKEPRTTEASDEPATLWSRRDLLTRSGWAMVLSSFGIGVIASARLLFPRVRFTPPSTVVLGPPDRFAVGEVSERWKKSHGVILVRTERGFYALRSVCTHLGCVPRWIPYQRKLKCPCHGSGFHKDGIPFEGPAPRPLERFRIFLDDRQRIVVDTAVRLRHERGEWKHTEAFLAYGGGDERA